MNEYINKKHIKYYSAPSKFCFYFTSTLQVPLCHFLLTPIKKKREGKKKRQNAKFPLTLEIMMKTNAIKLEKKRQKTEYMPQMFPNMVKVKTAWFSGGYYHTTSTETVKIKI